MKFSDNKFLVLWEIREDSRSAGIGYVFADGGGRALGSVQTAGGALSDCRPILADGKAVWYVTSGSAPVFHTLDSSGKLTGGRGTGRAPS